MAIQVDKAIPGRFGKTLIYNLSEGFTGKHITVAGSEKEAISKAKKIIKGSRGKVTNIQITKDVANVSEKIKEVM